MISVPVGAGLFNLRVAGVWLHEGHVLLQGDAREDFWALPGGRVELMEPAEVALLRELREELNLSDQTRIERLLWIMQNFYSAPGWGSVHELGFYFLVSATPEDVARLGDTTRAHACAEPDSYLTFRWFALADLPTMRPILPPLLNAALLDLPATPQIITDQRV
ncbi:MAG TPA: NUDIX domain-containing protein [Ktedonobacterales bacterium]|nr:NUDIX domain-containing protein [Ktedonobacterales bacterium]